VVGTKASERLFACGNKKPKHRNNHYFNWWLQVVKLIPAAKLGDRGKKQRGKPLHADDASQSIWGT